jgi:hypothetical protein
MSEEHVEKELPGELKALEAALGGLKPAAGAIDRDRLMYLAGRASLERSSRISRFAWPLAAAALFVVSVTLGGRLYALSGRLEQVAQNEHSPAVENRQVAGGGLPRESVALSMPRVQAAGGGSLDYIQLRSAVLSGGVDALPGQTVQPPTGAAATLPTLRDAFLGS